MSIVHRRCEEKRAKEMAEGESFMEKNRTSKSEERRRLAEQALWIAHSLFDRGKTSGTTANLSFRYGDLI